MSVLFMYIGVRVECLRVFEMKRFIAGSRKQGETVKNSRRLVVKLILWIQVLEESSMLPGC